MPVELGTPKKWPVDWGGIVGEFGSKSSDSASLRLVAVTMIVGGVKLRSRDVGFSSCFSSLEDRTTS